MALSSIKEKLSPAASSFKSLYPLIWPLFLSLLTRRFLAPISVAFAGRVGTKQIGAVGISFGLLTVTATGLGSGLAVTFEAMASRSYGERNYHNVGVLLQKAFIFAGFLCVLVAASWVHAGVILTTVGVPADVAYLTEKYLLIYIPAMLGICVFRLQRGYLLLLRHPIPSFVVAVIGVVLLVPINFLFMNVFHMGVAGVAISNDITNVLEITAIFLYMIISGVHKETWPGFSKKCFLDWKTYLSLAVPGACTFLLKSMIHEIALISVGSLGDVPVAAQTALFTLTKAMLVLAFSIGMPMNINMSKHFGEGKPNEARTTAIVGCLFNFFISIIFAVCLVAFKDIIGHIFTNDVEVIRLISTVVPYVALSFLLESITTVMFIMCVALRLQTHSIIVYAISSYIIGLPLGMALALHFKELALLWCGLIAGFLVQLFMFAALLWWKVDFEEMSKERQTESIQYISVNSSDYSDREEVKSKTDGHAQTVDEDCERTILLSSSKERKLGEDAEVPSQLIVKRLLVLGISIVILAISITLRFFY